MTFYGACGEYDPIFFVLFCFLSSKKGFILYSSFEFVECNSQGVIFPIEERTNGISLIISLDRYRCREDPLQINGVKIGIFHSLLITYKLL